LAGLLNFGIGNTTEVFHFLGNLELTKIWIKIWVSTGRTTGKSNFMNDKGIPSTPTAFDLMDITASQISASLTVTNENSGTLFVQDTANSPAPFSKGLVKKIIVQMLNIHLNLGSLRGIDTPNSHKFWYSFCSCFINCFKMLKDTSLIILFRAKHTQNKL
jgi:hypothetical protein